ncbi:MAG: response regulator [Deltaproteobacteria bacterium]|jgi:CheY-like chemotaxis protein|nr:response regulator [Deltaproteobacteria bacterium]MBT4641107.1 response regulator [Deltaproteobacteria bacterium]MBT6504278.1 response regulator [Deltaproteobacteria bacterium]MBT6611213.1 response regulator [Deltaproteobacteria bacterium]MBT7155103.1 response regulator [Deltaproteobacteria bacterium]
MKILVVDDNVDIQKMLKRKLLKQDWEVFSCENGAQAIEMAWEVKPDLILMDMHMPVMDGHEATRTLRAQGYQGKIAALTASVMHKDTKAALQDGCDYFIAKPLSKDFVQDIKKMLTA